MSGVFTLDPLADSRWDELVSRHPSASIFHTRGWLEALRRTYGFEPMVLTTTAAGPLANGLVLCHLRRPWSRRLVSLPYSDHCQPLVSGPDDLQSLVNWLRVRVDRGEVRSVELRPRTPCEGLATAARYCHHELDLAGPLERVFAALHPSSTRRAIRRAERETLTYEAGRTDCLLSIFYGLFRLTRRRHGLPPQPIAWFRNLAACLGDRLVVHVARKDDRPIASIVTLASHSVLTYKYGGSDARHHALGGMPFLLWRAVEAAHRDRCRSLDLGRSDLDQPGLLTFKDHLGAQRRDLTYAAYPAPARVAGAGLLRRAARKMVPHLPDPLLDRLGRLAYGYLG